MLTVDERARPPYIRFETRADTDRQASEEAGHVVYKNVDYIIVVPSGGKDEFVKPVDEYFRQKRREVIEKRFRADWLEHYEKAYKAWTAGNEIPLNGTPIKEWPVATPADVAQCHAANVMTVEDLAEANDTALNAIGMNARNLQRKARAWFEQARDQGKIAEQVANLSEELERRDILIESLQKRLEKLEGEKRKKAA